MSQGEGLRHLDQVQALVLARKANLAFIGEDFPWPHYDRLGNTLEVFPTHPEEMTRGLVIERDDAGMIVIEPTGTLFSIPFAKTSDQAQQELLLDRKEEVSFKKYEEIRSRVRSVAIGWREYNRAPNLPPHPILSDIVR